MKLIRLLLFVVLLFTTINLCAQVQISEQIKALPSASEVLSMAIKEAAPQNKKVLLMFHASWCGWCHKMDSSLNDKTCKKFFDDNFVITHITVTESKGKEDLENPGGLEMMEKYNGKDQGLPYWVIFDKEGKLLFDSQIRNAETGGSGKGQNVGCPATKPEVDHFISILKKTTSLSDAELAIIAKRFRQNEK